MERKMIPLTLMLIAGAICSIVCFIQGYDAFTMLLVLFIVLLVFYFLGCVIKLVMEKFEQENEEKSKEEGEVIEKETSDENETETSDEVEEN